MRPSPALLPLCLGLAIAGPAQGLVWDVPPQGALVYERTTERCSVAAPPRLRLEWLLPGRDDGGHEWRYLACARGAAPAGFEQPSFDDRDWLLGRGEFAPTVAGDPKVRTLWRSDELCLRTSLDLGRRKPRAIVLHGHHDDGFRLYCNGALVLAVDDFGRDRTYVLTGDQLAPFQPGANLIAVHCVNVGGAQYFDLALGMATNLPPGVRTGDDLLAALRADRDAGAGVERELFAAYRPPPLVLHGELDRSGERPLQPPADLRELAWFVAMDLQKGTAGGSYQADLPRLFRLGDLVLRGKVLAVDASGEQELEVAVKNAADVLPRGDNKRFVAEFVRPHVAYGFDGRLRIRRRLELAGGKARVVAFRSELSGRLLRGKDWKEHAADLEQIEAWRLLDVRDNQDAVFRLAVRTALDRGTARLKAQLGDLAQPVLRAQPPDADNSYHSGRLALGLLALLKGGVPRHDPVVAAGVAELKRRALIDTYSLGNALMCLEAYHAPDHEFADLKQGVIDRPRHRTVPPEDLAVLQEWTQRLLQNVDTRVDAAYLLRFNYTRGPRFDHSVTQYALLGLYSAHLCGVAIPATVWEAAANHLIANQADRRGRLDLTLLDYRTLARLERDPDGRRTVTRLTVQPAGWSYTEPKLNGEDRPVWGSMTCAGITGLAICQAALLDQPGLKRARLQNEATAARNAGFGWLAEQMSLRFHPGSIEHQHRWFYYYLYSLERAALLSGVARIQDRDWYFEGAMVLVLAQLADGSWPGELMADHSIERNAMAILFLKQSTLPVLTGQ